MIAVFLRHHVRGPEDAPEIRARSASSLADRMAVVRGVPPKVEKATAFGKSFLKCPSGLGLQNAVGCAEGDTTVINRTINAGDSFQSGLGRRLSR